MSIDRFKIEKKIALKQFVKIGKQYKNNRNKIAHKIGIK